jgi:hypothetical protein
MINSRQNSGTYPPPMPTRGGGISVDVIRGIKMKKRKRKKKIMWYKKEER